MSLWHKLHKNHLHNSTLARWNLLASSASCWLGIVDSLVVHNCASSYLCGVDLIWIFEQFNQWRKHFRCSWTKSATHAPRLPSFAVKRANSEDVTASSPEEPREVDELLVGLAHGGLTVVRMEQQFSLNTTDCSRTKELRSLSLSHDHGNLCSSLKESLSVGSGTNQNQLSVVSLAARLL